MPPIDDNELIEIPIDEIALEIDAETGMPKTVPGAKAATGAPIESEAEPEPVRAKAKEDPALAALKKERDEAKAEAERHAREAASERRRTAEALERVEKANTALDSRTTQAIGAHRTSVRERYERIAADHQAMVSGVAQAEAFIDASKRDLKAAAEANDYDRVAEIQAQLGAAGAQLSDYRRGKAAAEAELATAKQTWEDTERAVREAEAERNKQPDPEPQAKGPKDWNDFRDNYAEGWIDTCPAATQSWLREHKGDVLKDQRKFDQVNAFAKMYALDNGGDHALNSPEFVEALDAKFFPKAKEEDDDVTEEETTTPEAREPEKPTRRTQPAAPVSRTASPAKPSGGSGIKLTKEQYEHAPELYATVEDFDPEIRQRFPVWSPTAARYQYDAHLKRAHKEQKHLKIQ